MKIKILITLIVFFASNTRSVAQNYKFFYGKLVHTTDEDLNKITDLSVRENIIQMNKSFEDLEYVLSINKNVAKFSYYNKLEKGGFNKRIISFGGGGNTIFYDLLLKTVVVETDLADEKLFVKKEIGKYKWNITSETKYINDYLCYKAIANISYNDFRGKENYNIVTWFCPEFPYPLGPDEYFGLPGLVFEAHQENSKIKFVLKRIEKTVENAPINYPYDQKTMSEQEFTDFFNKVMNEIIDKN
jgi:GLPGLI family protein